jgi:peptidoglycan hydrolase-like protein with peptidoglycan-binding domain
MNLRDLMTKLDTIAEADDARAQYDKFKADDARAAAVAQVKTMLKPNGGGNFIDPKDGIVKWQEQMQGEAGLPGSVREFPYDWYTKGQESKFFDMLKTAGLEVVPVERKDPLFGIKSQVVGIKGGPQALANLDKPVAPAENPNKPVAGPKGNDDAKKLAELVAQLEKALAGGGGTAPATTTTPATTTPGPTPGPTPKPKDKSLNWKELALATGASAIPGAVVGGLPGAAVTGLAGGGTDLYHQLYREGTEFNSGIAQSLVESFGYQLDELADNPNLPGFMQTKYNVSDPLDKPLTARGSAGANVEAGRASYKAPELPAAEVPKAEVPKAAPNFSGGQMQGNVSNVKYAAPEMKAASTGVADIAKTAPAAAAEAPKIAAGLQKAGVPIAKSAEEAAAQVAAKVGAKAGGKMLSKLIPGVGLVVGTVDAIKRAQEGDWTGAGIAGVSAALSLVPGVGGAVSMGLDAANLARDYKAGKFGDAASPTGTTGGDAKLMQLQKIIGAKPDGIMGPETKQKLVAWQQSQGLTPDGLPGPATYGKAGIKESQQTVAEGIRSLQERLQLIETKAAIRETLEQRYYLDEYYYMYNGIGEQVTDLTTISVINDAYEKGEVEIVEGLGSALWNMGKDAVKGAGKFIGSTVKGGASPAAAERLAKMGGSGGKALSSAEKAGLKTGAAISKNPIKAGLGAAALGAGGMAALGGGDAAPAGTTTGGGAGGAGGAGDIPGTTTTPDAGGMTPEIAALVKQIHDLELQHGDDESPEWIQATQHAQAVLDKAEHASAAQSAMDAKNDTGAPNVMQPPPADNKGAAAPAGTTTPDPTLKVYKDGGGAGAASNPAVKESSDNELARWLKIARG